MISWSSIQSQMQDQASDSTTSGLTFLKRNYNIGLHLLESELGSFYQETTRTGTTTAGTDSYQLPEDFVRSKTFYITTSNIRYVAQEIFDEETWQGIKSNTSSSRSDQVQYYFVRQSTLEIFPAPSTSSLTWTLIYEAEGKDLMNDDYVTGTITTLANGGTAVTGTGTTFTSAMIGRYFRVDADGRWYPISGFTSTTIIALAKAYQGTAISAGTSAFTIAEMPKVPSPTQQIPISYAMWQYYQGLKGDSKLGKFYRDQWEDYMKWARSTYAGRYSSKVIPNTKRLRMGAGLRNPNLFPRDLS